MARAVDFAAPLPENERWGDSPSDRELDLMLQKEFRCIACELPEKECTCNRYCALCLSDYNVRLCEDGQYYCADCREACDYKPQDAV